MINIHRLLFFFLFAFRLLISGSWFLLGISTWLSSDGFLRRGWWCHLLDAICSAEFLNASLSQLFHVLGKLVDLAPSHVVSLAVVPYQLHLCEHILISLVLAALLQVLLDSGEIHGPLHDLWVVEKPKLLPCHGLQEWLSPGVILNRLEQCEYFGLVFFLDQVLGIFAWGTIIWGG